jgi:amino acid adenylation domain-containing protein
MSATERLDAIAIVGMAGRFPGAQDVREFWRNLLAGTESVTFFADHQLEAVDGRERDAAFVKARGVLDGVEFFDAGFFGFTPRDAELMDPQQRVFLETAWTALEDAGHDPARFPGAIGVYAGQSLNTYLLANLCHDRAALDRLTAGYQVDGYPTVLGNDKDYLATRVSFKLDLGGPSMTVQSACSTSLVAVAQACQALAAQQCDLALAGGVSITFPQRRGYLPQEGGIVSPDGHCRAFDAAAAGTVFGSGVGVVALRRYADALADGDHVYALIVGSALNNDGAHKVGYMAPSLDRQAEVIAMAHAQAGIDAGTIGYVEAHGTATPLGDPIEVAALTRAFRATAQGSGYCALGSVKTNIGHLEVASGVAGLIKAALAVEHGVIPASLHFNAPNPQIDFAGSPFRVQVATAPWIQAAGVRRAGVSSFGVGGTNAHVVLEEAVREPAAAPARSDQVVVVSARSAAALDATVARLAAHLAAHPQLQLADVAHTLQVGRRAFAHRRAVVARSTAAAAAALAAPGGAAAVAEQPPQVVFMFPGQGAQHATMGAQLYRDEPVFRHHVDTACAVLARDHGLELRDHLFANPVAAGDRRLDQTAFTQPALFVIGHALARLWQEWGVQPEAMIGHSVGEYVAACLAGVFSLEDALAVVATRGRLIQALPEGAMTAVRMSEAALAPLMTGALALAAVNGPEACVVAGPGDEVAALEAALTTRGIGVRRLRTSHAFHSPMVEPMLPEFAAVLRRATLGPPRIPIVSTVTGAVLDAAQATDPAYWSGHARQTVRFSAALAALPALAAGRRQVLLEVGPGRTLATLARQTLPDLVAQPSLGEVSVDEGSALAESLARLWSCGVAIDWPAVQRAQRRQRVSLPGYAFERQRHWVAPPAAGRPVAAPLPVADMPPQPAAAAAPAASSEPAAPQAPRRDRLQQQIAALLSELSGQDLRAIHPATSFLELGFDSLFLTQVSQALGKRFAVKVTFRQLLGDCDCVGKLADHLVLALPPEAPSQPAPATATTTAQVPSVPASPADSLMERVLRQQFEIMQQQLAMLRGEATAPVASQAVRPTTASAAAVPAATGGEFKAFGPYKPIQRGPTGALDGAQQAFIAALVRSYTARTGASKRSTQEHRAQLADPRVVAGFRAQWKEMVYPIVVERSRGARLWDVDGNEYIDLLNGFGASLFGHSPAFVGEAVERQLRQGIEIGPQSPLAGPVARMICEFTGLERATFCNTGSEAVMAAMRLARTVTGRSLIVSFVGDYHGTFDEVLVRPGGRPDGSPSTPIAPGIPQAKADNIVLLEYGSEGALAWLREHADGLAAVLIEPVQSRHPGLQPRAFLQEVRRITAQSGTAMIMDEVITGFRVHPGGAQAVFGVKADLATYGKVIGGGMPIGVLAGSARFMDALDGGAWRYGDESFPEVGVTFFAGTFVRHPLALAAAAASLNHLKREGPALQEGLNRRAARLVEGLNALFTARAVPTRVEVFGSIFYFAFPPEHRLWSLLYYLLRQRGIHIWEGFPSFITTAHSDADIDVVLAAFADAVAELQRGLFAVEGGSPAPAPAPAPATVPPAVAAPEAHPPLAKEPSGPAVPAMPAVPVLASRSFPLSEAQREIWLAIAMDERASCAYNDAVTLELRGDLDRTLLRQGLQRLMARHPALRTTFGSDGETQRVADSLVLPVTEVDLRQLAPAERAARARELCDEAARTPFDLVGGPLIRALVITLDEQRHALFLLAHHLVCDGWSFSVLLRELGAIYGALCAGAEPALPAAVAYRDYVDWESAALRGATGRADERFWLERLAGLPDLAELPADRPRPAQRSFSGATERIAVPPDLYETVRRVGAERGATVFATMLAAFHLLVQRLSGQSDVVVGIPAAGQSAIGQDALVGHCVNLLPVRLRGADAGSFATCIEQTRDALFDAQEHQACSFGVLVRRLQLPREPNRAPLISVLFNVDRGGFKDLPFAGLGVEVSLQGKNAVIFDLGFNIMETDRGTVLDCNYNTELFSTETIRRWLGYYLTLLAAGIGDPACAVTRLPLMGEEERRRVLVAWNDTRTDYPRDATIHQLFAAQAAQVPDAIAVQEGTQRFTYGELDQRANALARRLAAAGVGPDAVVGVCMERSIDLVVAVLAILKAGGAYLPLDPQEPRERLAFMIGDAQVAVLLAGRALSALLAGLTAQVLEVDAAALVPDPEPPPTTGHGAERLAYVIYTSGSTGRPKGVAVEHRGVVRLVRDTDYAHYGPDEVVLQLAPFAFDLSTFELWGPLLNGGRLVVMPDPHPTLADIGDAIRRYGITTMWLTAGLFHLMVDERIADLRPLRQLLAGGDVLSPAHVRRVLAELPGLRMINGYGPTECTTFACCHTVRDGDVATTVPIGRPIANSTAYILDEGMQPVPPGVAGELYLGGDGVARGYLNRPGLNAERFLVDPFAGGRLYRSGDRARWRPDGTIEFLGRDDHQVKLRGFRIELGEVQDAIVRHPGVREAVVTVREDVPGDKRLVAYLVADRATRGAAGDAQLADAVREHLRGRLPDYMVPSALVVIEALPLTVNGKVDRRALPVPSRAAARPAGDAAAAETGPARVPWLPMHFQLIHIWEEILGLKGIAIDQDFFALGGHSLSAVRMMNAIQREFGVRLPMATLLTAATIEGIAAALLPQFRKETRPLIGIQSGDGGCPFFYLHGDLLGGGVYSLNLARQLGTEVPFHVLPPARVDGQPETPAIEEMASAHVKHIRAVAPRGPYLLAGFCIGGVVAYEIARQLREQGEEIAFLGLIDAVGYRSWWLNRLFTDRLATLLGRDHDRRLADFARRNNQYERLRVVWGLPAAERWAVVRGWVARLFGAARPPAQSGAAVGGQIEGRDVVSAYLWATGGYRPRRYAGAIDFFMSEEMAGESSDPAAQWRRIAGGGVRIHRVPGRHLEAITTNVAALAVAMAEAMRGARHRRVEADQLAATQARLALARESRHG